jgi:methylated-DNA-[protein]-cysteine S-methyltransferase
MPASLTYQTPIGPLTVSEVDGAIVSLDWGWTAKRPKRTPVLADAMRQLDLYFSKRLRDFTLPLALHGSDFNRRVWDALRAIPWGEVASYGEVARRLGSGARAVGTACGANPISIFVPCHRVVGSGGRLGGYSGFGGLETKRFLLKLEGTVLV